MNASGIHRCLLKYLDKSIATEKIEEHLIIRTIKKIKRADGKISASVSLPEFHKLFAHPFKQVLTTCATPGAPSEWIDQRQQVVCDSQQLKRRLPTLYQQPKERSVVAFGAA